MTTAAIVFVLGWVILIRAPRTPTAGLLRRLMVEMPAAALNRLEPGHIALAIVVTMLVVVHLNAGDGDPIRMVALFAPDVTLLLASIEISVLVEAVVALAAAAAAAAAAATAAMRRAGIVATLSAIFVSLRRHRRKGVVRARKEARLKHKVPANDDEDGVKFALAS